MAELLGGRTASRLHHALWVSLPLADVSCIQLRRGAASNTRVEAHESLHRIQAGSHLALPPGNVVAFRSKDRFDSGRDDRWASSPGSAACACPGNFRLGVAFYSCSPIAAAVQFPSNFGGCIPLVRKVK